MKELIEIQQKLRIGKDLAGDGGKFKYRTAADILEAVKPILAEVNCSVILTDNIWECESNKGVFFLRAVASLWGIEGKIAEAEGFAMLDEHKVNRYNKDAREWVEVKSMSNEQATGSASSYARKYALCGLFAIDDAKQDPDGFVTEEEPKDQTKPKAQPKAESLETRIENAANADDINNLMAEVKACKNAKVAAAFMTKTEKLRLEFHEAAKRFVAKQQPQNKQ